MDLHLRDLEPDDVGVLARDYRPRPHTHGMLESTTRIWTRPVDEEGDR